MATTKEKMVWQDHTILTSSAGDKEWKVQINQHGTFRCSCPSFIFSKGTKTCKHVRHVMHLNGIKADINAVAAAGTKPMATPLPVPAPMVAEATTIFAAMCNKAAQVTGVRAQISMQAAQAMVNELAERLRTYQPQVTTMKVATQTEITVGVRRITWDDA